MRLRAVCSLLFLLLLLSCSGGDDDGRRLGEVIVATWQLGTNEGDMLVEGDLTMELAFDKFVFRADGSYNGMMRKGTFFSTDETGDIILEGRYQCDNHNLKLEGGDGYQLALTAQVLSFTDDTMRLQFVGDDGRLTVTLVLRKIID